MDLTVNIQATNNAELRRFELPFLISKEEVVYASSVQAQRSPLANKIFGFPWTQEVVVGKNFVIVKKQDWVDWEILAEPLAGLIREHFQMLSEDGIEQFEENPPIPTAKPSQELSQDPLAARIQGILDQEINPMVAHHGGQIALVDVTTDTVYVKMEGGCQGCASSKATLQQGVELAIKRAVPQIKNVIDVTDHEAGENPYFNP